MEVVDHTPHFHRVPGVVSTLRREQTHCYAHQTAAGPRYRTWQRHTTSASCAKISTSFPLPSSPHCPPSTTVTPALAFLRLFASGSSKAMSWCSCRSRVHWGRRLINQSKRPDSVCTVQGMPKSGKIKTEPRKDKVEVSSTRQLNKTSASVRAGGGE